MGGWWSVDLGKIWIMGGWCSVDLGKIWIMGGWWSVDLGKIWIMGGGWSVEDWWHCQSLGLTLRKWFRLKNVLESLYKIFKILPRFFTLNLSVLLALFIFFWYKTCFIQNEGDMLVKRRIVADMEWMYFVKNFFLHFLYCVAAVPWFQWHYYEHL